MKVAHLELFYNLLKLEIVSSVVIKKIYVKESPEAPSAAISSNYSNKFWKLVPLKISQNYEKSVYCGVDC